MDASEYRSLAKERLMCITPCGTGSECCNWINVKHKRPGYSSVAVTRVVDERREPGAGHSRSRTAEYTDNRREGQTTDVTDADPTHVPHLLQLTAVYEDQKHIRHRERQLHV